MKTRMRVIILSATLLCFGCASIGENRHREALTPSFVNEHFAELADKHIAVKGWIIIESENRNIWDSQDSYELRSDPKHCLSLSMASAEDVAMSEKYNRTNAVVFGIFRKNIEPDETTMLGTCNITGIEVTRVKSEPD